MGIRQSNGAAEKGVGKIKTLWEKMGRKGVMNQRELNQLCFKINLHQSSNKGSPLERFFGRYVRTYQPELVRKKIQHQQIIAARGEKQKKISEKRLLQTWRQHPLSRHDDQKMDYKRKNPGRKRYR